MRRIAIGFGTASNECHSPFGVKKPAMPQFLYRIQPTRVEMLTDGPTERESEIVGDHFAYLSNLTEKGVVLMAGRTLTANESTFGIVVLVASTEAEASAIMNNDPAVKCGVMQAELFPYRVALWSRVGPSEKSTADLPPTAFSEMLPFNRSPLIRNVPQHGL
jgi:uncharacterized protein YciI